MSAVLVDVEPLPGLRLQAIPRPPEPGWEEPDVVISVDLPFLRTSTTLPWYYVSPD